MLLACCSTDTGTSELVARIHAHCSETGISYKHVDLSALEIDLRTHWVTERLPALCEDIVQHLVAAPCFFVSPDGVAGSVFDDADASLFCRETAYHSTLRRADVKTLSLRLSCISVVVERADSTGAIASGLLSNVPTSRCEEKATLAKTILRKYSAAAIHGFLGVEQANTIAALDLFRELPPACPAAKPGAGRGDFAALSDELPMVLLSALDSFVSELQSETLTNCPITNRLSLCRFRSWPMVSAYPPGTRYVWHLDNPRQMNSRLLTCVYYLNHAWTHEDGGALRLLAPRAENDESPPHQIIAEIPPCLDTLVVFWADQVPHEVLPSHRRTRHAISVWYLCPCRGPRQLVDGTPLPMCGQSSQEAASSILAKADVAALEGAGHGEALTWLREQAIAEAQHDE